MGNIHTLSMNQMFPLWLQNEHGKVNTNRLCLSKASNKLMMVYKCLWSWAHIKCQHAPQKKKTYTERHISVFYYAKDNHLARFLSHKTRQTLSSMWRLISELMKATSCSLEVMITWLNIEFSLKEKQAMDWRQEKWSYR